MEEHTSEFRFYGELNDLLDLSKQQACFTYCYNEHPSVKDAIEALGVPHTEVDLILADGEAVDFSHLLHQGDHISVYPHFYNPMTAPEGRRHTPLTGEARFILDGHLGKLARLLRLMGYDCLYENNYTGHQIADIACRETRIVLTRSRSLLKHRCISAGFLIRSDQPEQQLQDVFRRYDLNKHAPLTRCMSCNGLIEAVSKEQISDQLQPNTARCFDEFYHCSSCRKIYWKGSHFDKLIKKVEELKAEG